MKDVSGHSGKSEKLRKKRKKRFTFNPSSESSAKMKRRLGKRRPRIMAEDVAEVESDEYVFDGDDTSGGETQDVDRKTTKYKRETESTAEPGKYDFHLHPIHCVKSKNGQRVYRCDVCGAVYRHAFSLKRHFLRQHINYDFLTQADISNCNINVKVEKKQVQENGSEDSSGKPGKFRCHICGLLSQTLTDLKGHLRSHPDITSSKRFPCSKCDMTFSHKQNLVRHISVHSGSKPFSCRYCSKCFPTATNQKRHERIHEGLKPYRCDHCPSVFTQSGDLKKHIRKRHNEHFHPCGFCLKYFISQERLAEHLKKHDETLDSNAAQRKKLAASSRYSEDQNENLNPDDKSTEDERQTAIECTLCRIEFNSRAALKHHAQLLHPGIYEFDENSEEYDGYPFSANDFWMKNVATGEAKYYATVAHNVLNNLLNNVDGKLPDRESDDEVKQGDYFDLHRELSVQMKGEGYYPSPVQYLPTNMSLNSQDYFCTPVLFPDISDERNSVRDMNFRAFYFRTYEDRTSYMEHMANQYKCLISGEKNIPKTFVCNVCGERLISLETLREHNVMVHPYVMCTHTEICTSTPVPDLFFAPTLSSVGILGRNEEDNEEEEEDQPMEIENQCSKCKVSFPDPSALHLHILECAGNADWPVGYVPRVKGYMRHRSINRGLRRKLYADDPVRKVAQQKGGKKTKGPKTELVKKYPLRHGSSSSSLPAVANGGSTVVSKKQKEDSTISAPVARTSPKYDFVCSGCGDSFPYFSSLERHHKSCEAFAKYKKSDAVEPPKKMQNDHCCPSCNRYFTYTASLKKHMLEVCRHAIKTSDVSTRQTRQKTINSELKHAKKKALRTLTEPKRTDVFSERRLRSSPKVPSPPRDVEKEEKKRHKRKRKLEQEVVKTPEPSYSFDEEDSVEIDQIPLRKPVSSPTLSPSKKLLLKTPKPKSPLTQLSSIYKQKKASPGAPKKSPIKEEVPFERRSFRKAASSSIYWRNPEDKIREFVSKQTEKVSDPATSTDATPDPPPPPTEEQKPEVEDEVFSDDVREESSPNGDKLIRTLSDICDKTIDSLFRKELEEEKISSSTKLMLSLRKEKENAENQLKDDSEKTKVTEHEQFKQTKISAVPPSKSRDSSESDDDNKLSIVTEPEVITIPSEAIDYSKSSAEKVGPESPKRRPRKSPRKTPTEVVISPLDVPTALSKYATGKSLFCRFCFRTFIYSANYHKHMSELCPLRNSEQRSTFFSRNSSLLGKFDENTKEFEKVIVIPEDLIAEKLSTDESMLPSYLPASSQKETLKDDDVSLAARLGKTTVPVIPEPKDVPTCNICFEKFPNYARLLSHRLTHKLNQPDDASTKDGPHCNISAVDGETGDVTKSAFRREDGKNKMAEYKEHETETIPLIRNNFIQKEHLSAFKKNFLKKVESSPGSVATKLANGD